MNRYPVLKERIPIEGRRLLPAEITSLFVRGIECDARYRVNQLKNNPHEGIVGFRWSPKFGIYDPQKMQTRKK
jgi:hypothetical protein